MTPERAKELIPLIQAYVDGKQIQYYTEGIKGEWKDTESPIFGEYTKYRVKPEQKLVPYDNQEDFKRDLEKNGGWLISKEFQDSVKPLSCNDWGVSLTPNVNNGFLETISYVKLLESFTFNNGKACGKIV